MLARHLFLYFCCTLVCYVSAQCCPDHRASQLLMCLSSGVLALCWCLAWHAWIRLNRQGHQISAHCISCVSNCCCLLGLAPLLHPGTRWCLQTSSRTLLPSRRWLLRCGIVQGILNVTVWQLHAARWPAAGTHCCCAGLLAHGLPTAVCSF